MGVPLPRPAAMAARLDLPVEEWPYLTCQLHLMPLRDDLMRQMRQLGWQPCPPPLMPTSSQRLHCLAVVPLPS